MSERATPTPAATVNGAVPACAKCSGLAACWCPTPAADGEADFAAADWFAQSIDVPMPPMLDVEPRLTCPQKDAYNLARAYLALRARPLQDAQAVPLAEQVAREFARVQEMERHLRYLLATITVPQNADKTVAQLRETASGPLAALAHLQRTEG